VLEHLISTRLERAIVAAGGLSDSQYGFRKAKSTVDAISKVVDIASAAIAGQRWKGGSKEYCLIVTLDIRNAFNTARWGRIMDALLSNFGVPTYLLNLMRNYFHDRMLQIDSDSGTQTVELSCGVPQGSVLAPLLWNAMYAGLQLAPQKTEAVLVSSRKKVEGASVRVCDASVRSSRAIKYLGVMIDTRLSFREHLTYASSKAATTVRALSRIMLNHHGPRQASKLLLATAARATMLYAAPVWSHAMATPSYGGGLMAAHRLAALRICSAFRT
ncbi:hypothetical protein KR059_002276, partial [Drosophila kikkawai]